MAGVVEEGHSPLLVDFAVRWFLHSRVQVSRVAQQLFDVLDIERSVLAFGPNADRVVVHSCVVALPRSLARIKILIAEDLIQDR